MSLARMIPYWNKLSKPRQQVLTDFINHIGMVDFLTFRALHAAITRGNTEQVCAMLGERFAEQYRKG